MQVQFAEHREIVLDHLKSVFYFPETRLGLEGAGQAEVDAVEVLVVPGKVRTVEDKEIFDHPVLAVQGATDKADHVFPGDADGAFRFHLVGQHIDLGEQFMGALGVKVEGDGVGHVEHGDAHDILRQLRHHQVVETNIQRIAGAVVDFQVVADFVGQWMRAIALQQVQGLAHVGSTEVGKHHCPIIEGVKELIVVYAEIEVGGRLQQQRARVGFLQPF